MTATCVEEKTSIDVLAEKIRARTARAGVVGLGYVGLPLAVELAISMKLRWTKSTAAHPIFRTYLPNT